MFWGWLVGSGDGGDDGGEGRVGGSRGAGASVFLAVDPEGVEDDVVEQLPCFGSAGGVELLGVLEQGDDVLEPGGDFVAGGVGLVDEALGVGELGSDLALAFAQGVDGQGVGEVGVEEFLLLPFELGLASALVGDEAGPGFGGAVQVLACAAAEGGDLGVGESGALRPFLLDGFLGFCDAEVGQVAVGAAGVAGEAEEVVVFAAAALGYGVADAAAAAGASQRSFEVVAVSPGAVASDAPPVEHVLDALPEDVVDQRLVDAVVLHAAEDQLALVVGVPQDAVHLGAGQRPADDLPGGAGLEAAAVERIAQLGDGPAAGGVLLVCPADVVGALGIRLDGADLDAVHLGGDVQVAQRGDAVGAAAADLLGHALLRLVGQVLRVVLGDGGHDAVHERAGWAVVDLLAGRDQGRAGGGEDRGDLRIVDAGAGQAVELVDDDVGDVALADALEHPLEPVPVGRSGRCAGVDEFLHDLCAELVRLAHASLALGRDRVALGLPVLGGLAGGGHPQVDQRRD